MNAPLRFPSAAPQSHEPTHAGGPQIPGFTDAFGDRHRLYDASTATSLDVLKFTNEFSDSPEFETALRARVDDATHLQHPSLATIRSVDRVEGRLSLVSIQTQGRRISELAPAAQGPVFALDLIRQVTPALATLHREGVAHGTLSAERIVVGRDGRLVLVEHVLGSAIEALRLSRARLNTIGLVVPASSDAPRFDGRSDMLQLGFIVLSLLLRRRLDPSVHPEGVPALLDEFVESAGSPLLSTKMRVWLERALQMSPTSFASARDAQDAVDQLPNEADVEAAESARDLLAFTSEVPELPKPETKSPQPEPAKVKAKVVEPVQVRATPGANVIPQAPRDRRPSRAAWWIVAALALLAAGEGVVIAALFFGRPPAEVIEIRSPLAAVPAPVVPTLPPAADLPASEPPTAVAGVRTAASVPPPPRTTTEAPSAPGAAALAAGPRLGGLAVSASIDLQVFKDGKLIGSSAGPIAIAEGTHEFEVANASLGFRQAQTVSIKSGQMTPLAIALPNGRVSINALPWAEVSIDGNPSGETPLANVPLTIGTHEIVFRNPQLGVRRQTIVVKVGELLRVTEPFK